MNKKKGFSLVELIAVIVILAIILVIAVPRILTTIDETDKKAFSSDLNELIGTSKLEYNEKLSGVSKDVWYYFEDGKQVNYDISGQLHFKGNTPLRGYILVTKDGEVELELTSHNGKYCASKELEDKYATIDKCEVKEQEPFQMQLRTTNTTNSIRVDVVSPTDLTIFYYKIKQNQTEEVEFESSDKNYRVYNNLKKNKTYYITVRGCRKKEVVCDEKTVEVTLPDLNNPTFTIKSTPADQIESQGWATSREVTINYTQDDSTLTEYKDLKKQYLYASTVDEISQKVFNNEWTDCEYESCTIQPEFTSDTFVIARITDGTNELGKITQKLTNFDTEKPTTPEITGGSNNWSSTNRTISVSTPSKAKSGIKKYQYYISTSTDKPEQEDNAWTDCTYSKSSQIFIEDGTYYVFFRAISFVDLKSDASSYQVIKIDTGVPTAPEITGGSDTWINGNRTISVSTESTSLSGIKNYQYYISTSATSQTGGDWIDLPANQKSQVITTEGTRYIYFRAVNNAGTIGKISLPQTTKIDTGVPTAPEITGGSTDWTKSSRTIKVSKESTSTSGINHYQYYVSTSTATPSSTDSNWTDCTTSTTSQTITTEGTYYIFFMAVNNAGTTGKISAYQVVKIDTQKPDVPTSEIRYGSSTGTVKENTNTWTNQTLWWGNFYAKDNGAATTNYPSGIDYYEWSTGCTGTKSGTLNPSYTYSSAVNYTFCIRAIDKAGNISDWSDAYYIKIDKTTVNPTITAKKKTAGTTVASGTWSNQGLNFTLATGTTGSSGATIYYCQDTTNVCDPKTNGIKATSGTAITSYNTLTGTYYVRYYAVTGAGTSSEVKSYTANVDTTTVDPIITATKKTAGTTVASGAWSNEGLNFTLTAGTTNLSGTTIYYCKDTTNKCDPKDTSVGIKAAAGTAITTYNNILTGTYYIRYYAKTGAENSSSVKSYTANMDTTIPTVSYNVAGGTYGSYQTVRITGADTNFSYMSVQAHKDGTVMSSNNSITSTTYDVSLNSNGRWTVYTKVFDKAGNKQNTTPENTYGWYYQTYLIDTTIPDPVITVTKATSGTEVTSGTWSNEGLNFKFSLATVGPSGATIYYCIDTTNACIPTTAVEADKTITSHNTLTGTYYIRYYAPSGAGNAATAKSYTAKVDTSGVEPQLKVTKKTAGTQVTSGTWSNEGLNFTLTPGTSNLSGATLYYCKDTTNTCNPKTAGTQATAGTAITTYNNILTGTYYFRYYAKTGAGKESSVSSYTANVDTTIPTVSYNLAGGTYNTTKTVRVTGADTNYSYMKVHVYKDGTLVSSNDKIISTIQDVSLNSNGTWTIYTQVYDKAGNKHNKSPDNGSGWYYQSYLIDTTTPKTTITATKATSGTEVTSGTWSNEGLNFKFTVSAGPSGATIYYCKDTANTCTPTTVATAGTTITTHNTTTGTYYIRYYSKSGSVLSESVKSYTAKVDTTIPTVSYNLAGGYYNATKTVTVTGADTNFNYMNVHVYKDGTKVSENNSITSKTLNVSIDSAGTWTIYTKVFDKAGNKQSTTPENSNGWYYQTYIIDTTLPTVSYNLSGGTYNATKTVRVTGADTNFNYMDVHVYKNGSFVSGKSVSSRTSTTFDVALDSDGTWTVYTRVYDKAGNKHSKSPDNGGGWYYQNYIIDTTKPTTPTYSAFFKSNTSSKYTSGAWTNQTVQIKISSTDATSGVSYIQYSTSSTATTGTKFTFPISALAKSGTTATGTDEWTLKNRNDTYYIRAVDAAGNVSDAVSFTIRYDTTAPTCTSSGGSTTWTSGSRTLTGTCADTGGSGCKANVTKTISDQGKWTNQSPGTVYDNAGNSVSCPANQSAYIGKYANISYTVYLADGTTESGLNGTLGGTVGKSMASQRIAISAATDNTISGGISYSIHQQSYGDLGPSTNGSVLGNLGYRIEQISISLTGDLASAFDVYYRVHVQGQGWLNRVSNGTKTGSSGLCKRIEAIQIKAVPKGSSAPSFDNSGSSTTTNATVLSGSSYSNCESTSTCTNQTCSYTATCYKYWGGYCGANCTVSQGGAQVNVSNCSSATSCCCQIPYSCTKTSTCCK